MDKPLISIITVVFNAKSLLDLTILTVINQTYTNIEYIVIDGGSTDGTVEIIKKYQDKIKYWISEPDEGVYDAMNKGINAATGDWIYFLGAGDILLNVFDKIVPLFKNDNYIYYGDVYKLDSLEIYDGRFSAFKLAIKNICHQAIFYPTSALQKYKYNLRYKILADHNLNLQCYGDGQYTFKYMPVQICIYEGDGFSALNPIDEVFFNDKLKIIRSNFPFLVFCYAYIRTTIAKLINGYIKQ